MKLLSITVPSYNSQDYLAHCIDSLIPGGDRVEILIVDDGSKDDTGKIADEYQSKYPQMVRAIHKENGGHGSAVMAGLRAATGVYFKVVDSDDWLDSKLLIQMLDNLEKLHEKQDIDLVIANYVYDKVGVEHKRVIRYTNALPEGEIMGWEKVHHFLLGQYILMHSTIYRRELLLESGLELPEHTFYVDNLYVYVPMLCVKTMCYYNMDLYHYFIGREDQSVNELVMIKRIDQQLRVNKMMVDAVDLTKIADKQQYNYMRNYLEIITAVSSVLCIKSGTEENRKKMDELWEYIHSAAPKTYKNLRHRLMGFVLHLPGKFGKKLVCDIYGVTQKIVGFN